MRPDSRKSITPSQIAEREAPEDYSDNSDVKFQKYLKKMLALCFRKPKITFFNKIPCGTNRFGTFMQTAVFNNSIFTDIGSHLIYDNNKSIFFRKKRFFTV